jgi:acid stress-induced BolA-like protein IbaG/YrbA
MVATAWVEDEVRAVVPDAAVECIDLNNTGDHFHVRVIAASFEGMRPLQRQKLILDHFKPHIASNVVHALDLRCMTPAQAEQAGDTVFHPHAGGTGLHVRRRTRTEE